MSGRRLAEPGMHLDEVETPALLVDLDRLEANIGLMAELAARHGVALRPHAKAHKSAAIAAMQVAAGAVGICCQKVSEAERLAAAGIRDILIANQVVDVRKLRRLAALTRDTVVGICVDHPEQVRRLAAAAEAEAGRIEVLIEIDVGQRRCGVGGIDEALRLAERVQQERGLTLRGIQTYNGAIQHERDAACRLAAARRVAEQAWAVRRALEDRGFAVSVVTGGGTGTVLADLTSGVFTEVQPGSYVFMDADYSKNEGGPALSQSLTVATTVISDVVPDQIVVDAGLKAVAVDCGLPVPLDDGLRTLSISDEHMVLARDDRNRTGLGDRVAFVPGHIDPTVNLHDWYVCIRRDIVVDLWPVDARGPGL